MNCSIKDFTEEAGGPYKDMAACMAEHKDEIVAAALGDDDSGQLVSDECATGLYLATAGCVENRSKKEQQNPSFDLEEEASKENNESSNDVPKSARARFWSNLFRKANESNDAENEDISPSSSSSMQQKSVDSSLKGMEFLAKNLSCGAVKNVSCDNGVDKSCRVNIESDLKVDRSSSTIFFQNSEEAVIGQLSTRSSASSKVSEITESSRSSLGGSLDIPMAKTSDVFSSLERCRSIDETSDKSLSVSTATKMFDAGNYLSGPSSGRSNASSFLSTLSVSTYTSSASSSGQPSGKSQRGNEVEKKAMSPQLSTTSVESKLSVPSSFSVSRSIAANSTLSISTGADSCPSDESTKIENQTNLDRSSQASSTSKTDTPDKYDVVKPSKSEVTAETHICSEIDPAEDSETEDFESSNVQDGASHSMKAETKDTTVIVTESDNTNVESVPKLSSQPVQTDPYLWAYQVWHRRGLMDSSSGRTSARRTSFCPQEISNESKKIDGACKTVPHGKMIESLSYAKALKPTKDSGLNGLKVENDSNSVATDGSSSNGVRKFSSILQRWQDKSNDNPDSHQFLSPENAAVTHERRKSGVRQQFISRTEPTKKDSPLESATKATQKEQFNKEAKQENMVTLISSPPIEVQSRLSKSSGQNTSVSGGSRKTDLHQRSSESPAKKTVSQASRLKTAMIQKRRNSIGRKDDKTQEKNKPTQRMLPKPVLPRSQIDYKSAVNTLLEGVENNDLEVLKSYSSSSEDGSHERKVSEKQVMIPDQMKQRVPLGKDKPPAKKFPANDLRKKASLTTVESSYSGSSYKQPIVLTDSAQKQCIIAEERCPPIPPKADFVDLTRGPTIKEVAPLNGNQPISFVERGRQRRNERARTGRSPSPLLRNDQKVSRSGRSSSPFLSNSRRATRTGRSPSPFRGSVQQARRNGRSPSPFRNDDGQISSKTSGLEFRKTLQRNSSRSATPPPNVRESAATANSPWRNLLEADEDYRGKSECLGEDEDEHELTPPGRTDFSTFADRPWRRDMVIRKVDSYGCSSIEPTLGGECNCSQSIFSGNNELIDFYLPLMGMACTCGNSKQSKQLRNPEEPTSLENILRPWQVDFLAAFGISRGDQLVKAHHRSAKALANAMRKYRKKIDLPPFRTKSCGMALAIWAKTSKAFVRSIRKQLLQGNTDDNCDLKVPNTLYILSSFLEKIHQDAEETNIDAVLALQRTDTSLSMAESHSSSTIPSPPNALGSITAGGFPKSSSTLATNVYKSSFKDI